MGYGSILYHFIHLLSLTGQSHASKRLAIRNGPTEFSRAATLIRIPESFIIRNPMETDGVLPDIRDGSELLRPLPG
jgi:hypothetical protein